MKKVKNTKDTKTDNEEKIWELTSHLEIRE